MPGIKKSSLKVAFLFVGIVLLGCDGSKSAESSRAPEPDRRNIVIILADDLGYGDLGVFGSPSIRTPNIDRLAAEGQKWTNFYVPDAVCTPSRGALLTGRLPVRIGLATPRPGPRSLRPESLSGLPASEITIAELLNEAGYATAAVGKWHLGHRPDYLPTQQGFDSYFGIPYSNDMNKRPGGGNAARYFAEPDIQEWDIPLYRDEEEIERPVDQTTITKRYTDEAVEFIHKNKNQPFFLYLAHTMPHAPLFSSAAFVNRSARGRYGDAVEEVDWSVGEVVRALKDAGVADNTLLLFTSDNGPWLFLGRMGGSAGSLYEGKATTWEGGTRVPAVFYGPGLVSPGRRDGIGSTLDLLPTIAGLASIELPGDRDYDGFDLSGTFSSGTKSPRQSMTYYRGDELYAFRQGAFKIHFVTEDREGRTEHEPPLLFNIEVDPAERFNIAEQYPDLVMTLVEKADQHSSQITPAPSEILKRSPLEE